MVKIGEMTLLYFAILPEALKFFFVNVLNLWHIMYVP